MFRSNASQLLGVIFVGPCMLGVNLLPLPMLDGGRVFFILIEILRGGKRVPPEKEALVHIAGFVVLVSLVVVVSYFDVVRIVNGDSPFR